MELREKIKFLFKASKAATETFQLLRQAYGNNAASRIRVFEWYARFQDEYENLGDDELSERPPAVEHLT
jgi:hypothetical protein